MPRAMPTGTQALQGQDKPPTQPLPGLRWASVTVVPSPPGSRALEEPSMIGQGAYAAGRGAHVAGRPPGRLARYSQASSEQTVLSAGGRVEQSAAKSPTKGEEGHKKLAEPVDLASFRGTRPAAANQAGRPAASSRDGQVGSALPGALVVRSRKITSGDASGGLGVWMGAMRWIPGHWWTCTARPAIVQAC